MLYTAVEKLHSKVSEQIQPQVIMLRLTTKIFINKELVPNL